MSKDGQHLGHFNSLGMQAAWSETNVSSGRITCFFLALPCALLPQAIAEGQAIAPGPYLVEQEPVQHALSLPVKAHSLGIPATSSHGAQGSSQVAPFADEGGASQGQHWLGGHNACAMQQEQEKVPMLFNPSCCSILRQCAWHLSSPGGEPLVLNRFKLRLPAGLACPSLWQFLLTLVHFGKGNLPQSQHACH